MPPGGHDVHHYIDTLSFYCKHCNLFEDRVPVDEIYGRWNLLAPKIQVSRSDMNDMIR